MRKYFLFLMSIMCCLCLLCACKSKEVIIVYNADDGGIVFGNLVQKIEMGEDCTQVYAVAETGYRFVGWSDGIKSSQRIDTGVEESKTITAQFEKIEYVSVKYIASEGGAVYGELNQKVEVGEDCTQVYAVAETGYRFVGWSDGIKSSQRIDTGVEESKTITAQFEKIEYVSVKYIASEGGAVYGELNQKVEVGEDCTQVYAVAETGYRFVGWSDGIKSSQRIDTGVEESKTITAQFEKIMVLFYSDGVLVRNYSLKDFETIDISKIVGYASGKIFERWEFTGSYIVYNCQTPLQLVKSYFVHMHDLPDITLNAVYSEIVNELNVPNNSKTIAHALGGIDNKTYLNSKEAFELSYDKGFKFFEADLALTNDGAIVLDHNRGQYSYSDFINMATEGYTPLSLENLLDYMVLYSDIWVDLDTFGFSSESDINMFISAFKQLVEKFDVDVINRLIVEI